MKPHIGTDWPEEIQEATTQWFRDFDYHLDPDGPYGEMLNELAGYQHAFDDAFIGQVIGTIQWLYARNIDLRASYAKQAAMAEEWSKAQVEQMRLTMNSLVDAATKCPQDDHEPSELESTLLKAAEFVRKNPDRSRDAIARLRKRLDEHDKETER